MSVHHQVDRRVGVAEQAFADVDEHARAHLAIVHHEPQLALGADGRQQRMRELWHGVGYQISSRRFLRDLFRQPDRFGLREVAADLPFAASAPVGHGHAYTAEFVDGWNAVLRPVGITPGELATLLPASVAGRAGIEADMSEPAAEAAVRAAQAAGERAAQHRQDY